MSKKNKLSTRRNAHAFALEREKQEQEKRQKNLEKNAAKAAAKGVEKETKKSKTFRIRKGVRVQGIIVKDSDSKKEARKILAARAALKMDIDDDSIPATSVAKSGSVKKVKSTKSVKVMKVKAKTKKDASKPAAMET